MTDNIDTSLPSQDDLPYEEASQEDLPAQVDVVGTGIAPSSTYRNMELGHAAILENHTNGTGIIEAFASMEASADSAALVMEKSAEKALADVADIEEAFYENPGVSPSEIGVNAELTRNMMTDAEGKATDPAHQVVEAASGLGALPEIQDKIKAQLTMLGDVQKLVQDLTTLDLVAGFGTAFIPGKLIKDNYDATGSIMGAESIMQNMIIGFKSMSAEDQLAAWPSIKTELLDALPKTRALPAIAAFLDPRGETKLHDFNSFWATLDAADVGLLGYGIAKRVGSLTKQLNGIKMLSKLDRAEEAAEINAVAMLDETGETAKAAGIDNVTNYNNTMPFNVGALDEAYAEGLSVETIESINEFRKANLRGTTKLISDEVALREELLTAPERAHAEEAFGREFTEAGFEDVQVVNRSPDFTEFKYSTTVDGEVMSDTAKMPLQLDSVGVWETAEKSLLPRFAVSPSAWAKGDTKEGAIQAIRLDNLSAAVGEKMRKLQKKATEPLLGGSGLGGLRPSKRAAMARVDEVLLSGDNQKTVYTPLELRSGVNGVKLESPEELAVYYNMRSLYDMQYVMRNAVERRKLVSQGMKEIGLRKHTEVGKVYESSIQAQGALNLSKTDSVFRDDISKIVPVRKLDLKKLYEEGFILTRLKQPIGLGKSGGSYRTILTKRTNSRELPEQVVHFKDGYVPKVNKNAYWFLKEETSGMIDGKMATSLGKTHRFFDNRKEANEVLEQFKKDNPTGTYKVLEDRELEQQILGDTQLAAGGGMYTGARSQTPIGFGKDNLPGERFGAFESLSMNIQNMQNLMSRNQWRMGMEKRWINTAQELGVDVKKFDPRLVPEGTESGAFLRQMGEQIQEWTGFPSKDEMIWDSKTRAMAEWALSHGANREGFFVKGLHFLEHKDPIAAARAGAFHTLLGWFNPAQLWVQAQGASIAITMGTKLSDPLGGARALKNQFSLMAANLGDAPAYRKHIAASSGMKVDELDEMVDLWRRTGLEDSVLTTADHAASVRSHGIAANALRSTADKGLFFYRGGELFNRRTSFLVALQEYKQANKGVKVTDDALKGILSRANSFMLNLSKANRSGFQKGLFSIPTQFLQVQTKMIEQILGLTGQFTRGERAKIVFGQLGMYGTAGVLGGDLALRWMQETLGYSQSDIEEMEPETVKAVTEGFWGWMALSAFGADIDVGNRGAIASGVESFTHDLLFEDSTLGSAISGAFGLVPQRFYQAYGKMKPYMLYAAAEGEFPDVQTVMKSVSALASVTSTWRNIEKAVFMRQFNLVLDSKGTPLVDKDFSIGTEIGQALGFTPSAAGRTFEIEAMVRESSEHRRTITDTLVRTMWDYSKEIDAATTSAQELAITEKYSGVQAILLQSLSTPRDVQLVVEGVQQKLSQDSRESRAIKKFIQEFNDGRVADIHTLNSSFVARGILQTVGPETNGE